jgi:hypothetical protein
MGRRPGRLQNRSRRPGEEKNLAQARTRTLTSRPSSLQPVAILTELSLIFTKYDMNPTPEVMLNTGTFLFVRLAARGMTHREKGFEATANIYIYIYILIFGFQKEFHLLGYNAV